MGSETYTYIFEQLNKITRKTKEGEKKKKKLL
jgi:hypothetical protein